MTDGLHVYLDSYDIVHLDETCESLRRCGATAAFVLVESVDGRRHAVRKVEAACTALRKASIAPVLYSFPDVRGDLYAARVHLAKCHAITHAPTQLDAEPHGGEHWTPQLLAPWLSFDRELSITTTRAEAPHLGSHDRTVWAQLESQTSIDTLDRALAIFGRYAPLDRTPLVTGLFDAKDDPRTVAEIRSDLARCTAQAKRTGRHGVWSAHTMTPAKADALREWAIATWAAPRAN